MALEQIANLARTNLNGDITNIATSITVLSATAFPSSPQFRIVVDLEIMIVTGISGTTWTVTRGVEGTSAVAHSSGATVVLVLTAGSLPQLWRDNGFTNVALGDRKPSSAGTYDEEFEGTADTLPANWAWDTTPSGSDAFTINSTWPSLLMLQGTGNATYKLTRSSFTPGAGDFGVWWKVFHGALASSDNQNLRIYIKNSGDTEARAWEMYCSGGNSLNMRTLSTTSNVESLWGSGVALGGGQSHLYGGLTRSSSNDWIAWYSVDGVAWWKHSTANHSFTVAKIVVQLGTNAALSRMAVDWIRYRTDTNFPQ